MKKLLGIVYIAACALGLASTASAELRVWADESGKTIEAEYVRTMTDKVVLRQADGTEIKVSLDTLSEKDRRYVVLQEPPRIDIRVSPNTSRSNTGYGTRGPGVQVQEETVVVEVNVRKGSPAPYEAPLKAEVYVMGSPEQADGHVILDRTASRFQFTTENKNEHTFSSGIVSLRQFEAGDQKGVGYSGYLVAITDKTGEVLELKCSKLDYEKNAETIMVGKKGARYDGDFEEMNQKKDGKKPSKPRKRPLPGRRF